jgi:hypothetical protein
MRSSSQTLPESTGGDIEVTDHGERRRPRLYRLRETMRPVSSELEAPEDLLLRSATIFAATGAGVQGLVHIVNFYFWGFGFLDANGEFNPFAWAHASLIVLAAFGATLHALADRGRRWVPLALAVILAFFSMDEILMIYERLARAVLDSAGWHEVWDSVLWPVLYFPLAAAMVLLLWKVMKPSPERLRRYGIIGVLWLVAAVILEIASAAYSTDLENAVHAWEAVFEEGAEFIGWTMIAASLNAAALYRLRGRSPVGVEMP